MEEIVQAFVKAAEIGLQAGIAVGLVLLCRQVFLKKHPKQFCCLLWMVVFFRFLCPVTPDIALPMPQAWAESTAVWKSEWENGLRTMGIVHGGQAKPAMDDFFTPGQMSKVRDDVSAAGQPEAGIKSEAAAGQTDMAKEDATAAGQTKAAADSTSAAGQVKAATDGMQASEDMETLDGQGAFSGVHGSMQDNLRTIGYRWLLQAVSVLWIAGAAAFLMTAIIRYGKLKKRIRTAVKSEVSGQTVWETDRIESPFVLGFVKPAIYLPAGLSETEKIHITAHEQAHIRRRDYLCKALCYLGVIVHWMNPFAWIAFYFYNQDMEMACDERALQRFDRRERLDYSRTLLLTAVKGSGLSLPVFFGESSAKKRVQNILMKKKRTAIGVCLTVFLVCVLAAFLFTERDTGQGMSENGAAADGTAEAADDSPISDENGGLEAYPLVKDGRLAVVIYNFSRWDYMYVNSSDYTVERKNGVEWVRMEPDGEVKRLAGQAFIQVVGDPYTKKITDLLSEYESEMEDGDYRILLQYRDCPVEDPAVPAGELEVCFSWKDGQPIAEESEENPLAEAEERWQERNRENTLIYNQDMADEEVARLRMDYNKKQEKILEEELAVSEGKLEELEARMESAGKEYQAAYSDFLAEVKTGQESILKRLDNVKRLLAAGEENINAEAAKEEREFQQLVLNSRKEELQPIEADIAAAKERLEEIDRAMGLAEAGEKDSYIEQHNEVMRLLEELQQKEAELQQELEETNREIRKYDILIDRGYDLVEEKKKELEALPFELQAEDAAAYGIEMPDMPENTSEARAAIRSFWEETAGNGSLPKSPSAMALEDGLAELENGDDPAVLHRRVKSMTILIGGTTDEGALLVTSITAWGGGYIVMMDQSRDTWKGKDAEDIIIRYYDYLNWLTSEDGQWEEVVASDRRNLTFEELSESMLSSQLGAHIDHVYIGFFENEN